MRGALICGELNDLRHLAVIAHADGHDGRAVEMTQDRVISTVERILASRDALLAEQAATITRVEAGVEAAITNVETHPVRNAMTREVTGYMLSADTWRAVRSQLRAALRPDPSEASDG